MNALREPRECLVRLTFIIEPHITTHIRKDPVEASRPYASQTTKPAIRKSQPSRLSLDPQRHSGPENAVNGIKCDGALAVMEQAERRGITSPDLGIKVPRTSGSGMQEDSTQTVSQCFSRTDQSQAFGRNRPVEPRCLPFGLFCKGLD